MDKCKSCCPLKVIEDYRNLEKDLSDEFADYIKDWFSQHPYVESIFVREDSICGLNCMSLTNKPLHCTVRLQSK